MTRIYQARPLCVCRTPDATSMTSFSVVFFHLLRGRRLSRGIPYYSCPHSPAPMVNP